MRKFRIAAVAMLVLIAATACQPRFIYVPIDDIIGGQSDATVSSQEEFAEAIANGEPVVLPSGTFVLDADDISKPLDIAGTDGSVLEFLVDSTPADPSADDNRGAVELPAGSVLKNIRIVFGDRNEGISLLANEDGAENPEPAFAMLIQNAATIDGVTFVFPEDGSLSGINIYNANGTVSLSDITVEGNPQRAPINITKSSVIFSGDFAADITKTAESDYGWYGTMFAVQVNGTGGSVSGASNLTFSNASGIDFVYQEYVKAADSAVTVSSPADIRKPGEGQTQVSGFGGQVFMMGTPDMATGSITPAGWAWFNEEMSGMIVPLYFTAPAHERFFNALNGKYTAIGTDYDGANGLFNTGSANGILEGNTISYSDAALSSYAYNNIAAHIGDLALPSELAAVLNARATGSIDIEFTVESTENENEYKATGWKISGDNTILSILMSVYAVADEFEISGTFGTSSSVSAPDNGPTFTVADGKVTSVDNTAKFYVAGAAGSATINGTTYTNISELATDDCTDLIGLVETLLPALGLGN